MCKFLVRIPDAGQLPSNEVSSSGRFGFTLNFYTNICVCVRERVYVWWGEVRVCVSSYTTPLPFTSMSFFLGDVVVSIFTLLISLSMASLKPSQPQLTACVAQLLEIEVECSHIASH